MRKLTILVVALMLAGCAHAPQVNRTVKSDKLNVSAKSDKKPAEQPTPNQSLRKRWGYFQIPKWLHR